MISYANNIEICQSVILFIQRGWLFKAPCFQTRVAAIERRVDPADMAKRTLCRLSWVRLELKER